MVLGWVSQAGCSSHALGLMLVLELCGLPTDWPVGLGMVLTPREQTVSLTSSQSAHTHMQVVPLSYNCMSQQYTPTEAVLMLQAGAEACGAGGGAFLVCFLQALARDPSVPSLPQDRRVLPRAPPAPR